MRAVVVPFRARPVRHDEVTARLSAVIGGVGVDRDDHWAAELRAAAEDLGPVFTCVASYLATRIDLLPTADCRELSRVRASVWPAARVADTIAAELGAVPIADLNAEPVSVSPPSQTHEGRLRNGDRVNVEVVLLDQDSASADLELVPLIRDACRGRLDGPVVDAAMADFRRQFVALCDCRRRLDDALAAAPLARTTQIVVPAARPEWCSPHVFVFEGPPTAPPDEGGRSWVRQPDAAVEVLGAWCRLALSGSILLVRSADRPTQDGRLTVTGGLARVPESSRPRLLEYLLAVAADRPDRAWAALAPELAPLPGAAPPVEVERAFRSLVPFRDDRTCDSGSEIADRAFLQWRTAARHGWLPSPHLVPFYQGLFAIATVVRDMAPGRDVFAEAIWGLRVDASARHFDEWSRNFDVMHAMERQMTQLLQMPEKIDQLLTIAAAGSVRVQVVAADDRAGARRSTIAAAVALLLVASGVVVLLGAGASPFATSEPLQSIGFLMAGGLLVWAVGRLL